MTMIGSHCPPFRLRTSRGTHELSQFHGQWLLVVHGPRAAHAATQSDFNTLAERLAEHDCRLLVGLDGADLPQTSPPSPPIAPAPRCTVGRWEGPRDGGRRATTLRVVSPDGRLAAVLEAPTSAPLLAETLIDLLHLARSGAARDAAAGPGAATAGCVDWFAFPGPTH